MPQIDEIYLDLDGVLAQCHEQALVEHKCGGRMEPNKPMHQIVNEAVGGEYWERGEFWNNFCSDFWASLPETDLYRPLRTMVGRSQRQFYILTRPTLSPHSYFGKAIWCDKRGMLDNLFISRHKNRCSAPGRLLVDDCPENVEAWRTRGGTAILVPRPWNIGHHNDRYVLDEVRKELSL